MKLDQVTVTVLAKNSQRHIRQVLDSLIAFGEVLLYDTGSTDATLEIARSFPSVRVVEAPFIGFGDTHNRASAAAKYDWILSIDSDELVSPELVGALRCLEADIGTVYLFPRHNYFNGKWIKGCGWSPDWQARLYNRQKTSFTGDQVHEAVNVQSMRKEYIHAPMIHYSYDSIADFLAKMQLYTTLFASQNRGKKRTSLLSALSHGFFAFFKSYFLKRGFLDGYEGFVISAYNGHTAYYKYLKLYEANQKDFTSSR